jgi:hypothetical protein
MMFSRHRVTQNGFSCPLLARIRRPVRIVQCPELVEDETTFACCEFFAV